MPSFSSVIFDGFTFYTSYLRVHKPIKKKNATNYSQSKNETETMDVNGNRIKNYLKRIE